MSVAQELPSIKNILISQSEPLKKERSPYYHLAKKYNLNLTFRPFIEIHPVELKEFKKKPVNISAYTAVILTSRHAVRHFFNLCKTLKIEMPAETKYFCVGSQTANYLHKFIIVRKRKIFVGNKGAKDLLRFFPKHRGEKYLYPCSSIRRSDIPAFMKKNKYDFKEAIIYRTVSSDIADLDIESYDLIVFFSPSGVVSLRSNFPSYEPKNTYLAAFGASTARAIRKHKMKVAITAPSLKAPSMSSAIELFLKKCKVSAEV